MQTMRTRRDFRVLSSGAAVEIEPPRISAAGLITAARWPLIVLMSGVLLCGAGRVAIHAVDWLTSPAVSQVRSYHLQLSEAFRAGARG